MSMRRDTGRVRRIIQVPADGVDISGQFLQYNFSSANVTKGGTDLISQVNDLSGNSYHATATVDANKLLWLSADLNGVDVAQANDTALRRATKLSGLPLSAELGITIIAVVQVITPNSVGNSIRFLEHVRSTGAEGLWLGAMSTTPTRQMSFISSAFGVSSFTFGSMPTSTWEIWAVRATSTAINAACDYQSARVNGVAASTTGTATFQSPSAGTPQVYVCGKSAAAATNYKCAEIHYWRRKLDDASVASVETTLNAKYAIY